MHNKLLHGIQLYNPLLVQPGGHSQKGSNRLMSSLEICGSKFPGSVEKTEAHVRHSICELQVQHAYCLQARHFGAFGIEIFRQWPVGGQTGRQSGGFKFGLRHPIQELELLQTEHWGRQGKQLSRNYYCPGTNDVELSNTEQWMSGQLH